jgi:hypothetical protein
MAERHPPANSPRSARLAAKMGDKPYRHSYVASHTRQFLARQMREFRGEQSQSEFGETINRQQTVVSRMEDPNYGKWTLQTLFDVAEKLDVAVFARFVDFPNFLKLTEDISDRGARPKPYRQEALNEVTQQAVASARNSALQAFLDGIGRGQQISDSVEAASRLHDSQPRPPLKANMLSQPAHSALLAERAA